MAGVLVEALVDVDGAPLTGEPPALADGAGVALLEFLLVLSVMFLFYLATGNRIKMGILNRNL